MIVPPSCFLVHRLTVEPIKLAILSILSHTSSLMFLWFLIIPWDFPMISHEFPMVIPIRLVLDLPLWKIRVRQLGLLIIAYSYWKEPFIVDLPINSMVDLSIATWKFTRGYSQLFLESHNSVHGSKAPPTSHGNPNAFPRNSIRNSQKTWAPPRLPPPQNLVPPLLGQGMVQSLARSGQMRRRHGESMGNPRKKHAKNMQKTWENSPEMGKNTLDIALGNPPDMVNLNRSDLIHLNLVKHGKTNCHPMSSHKMMAKSTSIWWRMIWPDVISFNDDGPLL